MTPGSSAVRSGVLVGLARAPSLTAVTYVERVARHDEKAGVLQDPMRRMPVRRAPAANLLHKRWRRSASPSHAAASERPKAVSNAPAGIHISRPASC